MLVLVTLAAMLWSGKVFYVLRETFNLSGAATSLTRKRSVIGVESIGGACGPERPSVM